MNTPYPSNTYPWNGGVQSTYPTFQNPYGVQPTASYPQFSRPYISGRMVSSPDEIQPNEVAMDGTVSFFPTHDCKAVYAKQWNKDGTISTIEYRPVVTEPTATSEPALDATLTKYIDAKFDDLTKLIKQQRKPYQKYQKKEDNNADGSEDVRS